MQTTRTLKVYPSLNNPYPRINLQGKWVQQFGFGIGDYIEVTIKDNRLIITNTAATSYKYNMRAKKLKVYQAPHSPYPRINLSGKWVSYLGFDIGDRIEVTMFGHQLIISKIDEDKKLLRGNYSAALDNMTSSYVRDADSSYKPRGRRPNSYYLNRKGGI